MTKSGMRIIVISYTWLKFEELKYINHLNMSFNTEGCPRKTWR